MSEISAIPPLGTNIEAKAEPAPVTDGIDIDSMDVNKNASESLNCVEFVILTLSQSLELLPKQAAGLLAKSNLYLTEACTRGVKGGFEKIIDWYTNMQTNSNRLSELIRLEIENNPKSLNLVMETVKCGLASKSEEVTKLTSILICKLGQDFSVTGLHEEAWNWFMLNEEQEEGK